MKKILILIIFLMSSSCQMAFAEKIPVKISPIRIISTHNDETEIGDWIKFEIVNDVLVDDELYLQKGSPIYGFVDFLHPNGWAGDSAEIKIKTFETTDIKGKKVIINYPLKIEGNNLKANDIKYMLAENLTRLIRGSEIYIEPDTKVFNIFITK